MCEGTALLVSVADQVLKKSKQEIARTGKRPREAYRDVLVDVTEQYGQDADEIGVAIRVQKTEVRNVQSVEQEISDNLDPAGTGALSRVAVCRPPLMATSGL